jgi:hypothetical protein
MGRLAAAVTPVPLLELALVLDGRHDRHPDEGEGAYGGSVGDPRLLARLGSALGDSARLGGELSLWIPGGDAPSVVASATTVDANLLFSWVPPTGPWVATKAGFRLDNSAEAAPDRSRLRFGDRVALGLSDSNAVLLGAGLGVPFGQTELLGEITWDLLVGPDAPAPLESPLRVTAGVRHGLTRSLALEILAEGTASSRPGLTAADPLVPIEPRFAVLAGLRFRLPFEDEVAVAPAGDPAKPADPTPAVEPAVVPAAAVVEVVDEAGKPVAAAVTVKVGEWAREAAPAQAGNYRFEGVPTGEGTVTVQAEGFATIEQKAAFGPGMAPVRVNLVAAPPSGQLRGLVRSFSGKGLRATIKVEPLGTQVAADTDGSFTLDVPPGEYEVVIAASGFTEQRRKVKVDDNGVTVLNAELFEAKR